VRTRNQTPNPLCRLRITSPPHPPPFVPPKASRFLSSRPFPDHPQKLPLFFSLPVYFLLISELVVPLAHSSTTPISATTHSSPLTALHKHDSYVGAFRSPYKQVPAPSKFLYPARFSMIFWSPPFKPCRNPPLSVLTFPLLWFPHFFQIRDWTIWTRFFSGPLAHHSPRQTVFLIWRTVPVSPSIFLMTWSSTSTWITTSWYLVLPPPDLCSRKRDEQANGCLSISMSSSAESCLPSFLAEDFFRPGRRSCSPFSDQLHIILVLMVYTLWLLQTYYVVPPRFPFNGPSHASSFALRNVRCSSLIATIPCGVSPFVFLNPFCRETPIGVFLGLPFLTPSSR